MESDENEIKDDGVELHVMLMGLSSLLQDPFLSMIRYLQRFVGKIVSLL